MWFILFLFVSAFSSSVSGTSTLEKRFLRQAESIKDQSRFIPLLKLPEHPEMPTSTFYDMTQIRKHARTRLPLWTALWESQYQRDQEARLSAPLGMYEGEILPDGSRLILWNVLEPLKRGTKVMIFNTTDDLIIKYQSNCYDLESPLNE